MNLSYHKFYINDTTLSILLGGSEDRRYSWVKRALKEGTLLRLKRGLYLIGKREPLPIDSYEIAQQLYGPSYISFESALSHHGWIPEAVYTITSASSKRDSTVQTPIGIFSYQHTPWDQFFMGVERVVTSDSTFLMAHPWKALADYLYAHHKKWQTLSDVIEDLRLDESSLQGADKTILEEIAQYYDSPRVRRFAHKMLKDLRRWL
ncbi:MAG: hypothetical protein JSS10_06860 [Verrucomicrobia bacterium]|nr:hypothetical protein [Verrucomicrobiota bacterium]